MRPCRQNGISAFSFPLRSLRETKMSDTLHFSTKVETAFIEEGFDPACFVRLDEQAAAAVAHHRKANGLRGGFGSLRVEAVIGATRWQTTLNSQDGGYSLPIKKAVRVAENLQERATVAVSIELL